MRIRDQCAEEVSRYRREHRAAERKWVEPEVDRKPSSPLRQAPETAPRAAQHALERPTGGANTLR